ncbi:unnamed protein product [Laminaria digitata]
MSCNTTPPLSLPGRGWGDSGSSGCVGHFGPSYSNSLYDGSSQGVHSSVSGGSRGSLSSGVSSGYGYGGGGGDEEPMRFRLEDGFSSAEEETWGSEGEIEETSAAGRYAVVGTGGRRVSDGGEAREALLAPFCGSGCGVGKTTDVGRRSNASLALGGRRAARKAAVGAGRAKRAVALAPPGRDSCSINSGPGETGGSRRGGGGGAGPRRGGRCGGSSGSGGGGDEGGRACNKRPSRLSRPLFIEIENKASEPPVRVAGAAGAGGAARRQKGSVVVAGQRRGQQRNNPARPQSSSKRGDDGELEDSDDEGGAAWCGCAQRCLRQAEVWYQALTGAGTVKFSEVGQASPSSLSAAV